MRKTGSLLLAAVFFGGCLDAIVPDHSQDPQTQSGATGGPAGDPNTPTDDAGVAGGGDDMAMATGGGEMGPAAGDLGGANPDLNACVPKSASIIDGHHNAGTDCLQCHNGTAAPKFYLGGTLYSAVTGGAGVAQATIEITDSNNQTVTVVTAAQNAIGNFHYDLPLAFPLTVRGSSCPTTVVMMSAVQSNGGGCASCHNATFQIHLP
jgi:hypothetical protein